MRIPPFISPGDTIGLVAPSFGAVIEPYATRLRAAIETFEARGYKVKAAPSCYMDDGLGISTDPARAASDLMDFYLDDSIDALISVGGGELMCETISRIDFDALKGAPPKWFMGYSDNTNFIVPMAMGCDVAGIYGPCATGYGKPWEGTEEQAFGILEGRVSCVRGYEKFELPENGDSVRKADPLARYVLTEDKVLRSFVPSDGELREAGKDEEILMSGTLMGGCLDILTNLAGTSFADVKGFNAAHREVIWMLEACYLNPMSIRRAVWNLRESGFFESASGFIIGRPLASFREEMMGVDSYNAVTDMVKGCGVPVIMDADIGHVSPMMPLVIGADARVSVLGNDISVDMKL